MILSILCIIRLLFVLIGYEQEEKLHKTYPCHGMLGARADTLAPAPTTADPAVRQSLRASPTCLSSRFFLQPR
jgi:hypothetical protein